VARDFAKALGIEAKRNGFVEGGEYVITWAIGHLVELAEPGDYDPKWKRWNMSTLPIIPERLRYKPIRDVKKQLEIVQGQLRRDDVVKVVIATDAGREGEVIARTILQTVTGADDAHRPQKAFELYRFWTSQALTPQVVRDTLNKLKPAAEFDRLWNAGQARQIADWLVGMNLSRAATLKLGSFENTFSVGRVQTAVLALLVDRRRERERFKPEPYWVLRANFSNPKGTWWGTWFKGDDVRIGKKEEAEAILSHIRGESGQVKSVKKTRKKLPPPLLYSLTDLQREANSRYGLSAKGTLDIAQRLYEDKKCLSYPRTDSKVLGSQTVDLASRLVEKLSAVYPPIFQGVDRKLIDLSNKRVFNDAKLTDHHALIPLAPLPRSASEDEKHIYDMVLKRFAAAFHPDYEYEATELITEVKKETFRTRGKRPLVPGWKAVYGLKEPQAAAKSSGNGGGDGAGGSAGEDERDEEDLPPLEKKDPAKVEETKLEEKMTQPLPEYTEDLLLKDMTNPSRYVTEEELQKIFKGDVGLGTQATRAQIIETLIHRQFVTREKKKVAATDKGCFLIERLRRLHRAKAIAMPEETARWEMELEKIALGIGNPEAFIAGIKQFVKDGVEELKMSEEQQMAEGPLGKCPACGGEIIEGNKGFGCKNWREQDGGCRFVVWKETAGRTITHEDIRTLLAQGVTPAMTFRSREGKEFSAALKIEYNEEQNKWGARFVFSNANSGAGGTEGEAEELGKCPRCGGEVVEGKKGFGCKNWREEDGGCRFVIWKTIAGKEIPVDAVMDLLSKGETEVIHGFISRKGNEFSARLRLEGEEYKATFVFDPR
jgi:DNA topoisomerase-3